MMFSKARDRMSSLTHFFGAIAAAVSIIAFLIIGFVKGSSAVALVSAVIFGVSMVLLYTASTVYHYVQSSPEVIKRLRKLDHAMIYVLIAGSYTPFSLVYMPGKEGIVFLSVIWGIALSGIVMKLFWVTAPNWLSALLYLAMGWAIMVKNHIFSMMQTGSFVLLLLGGIAYSVGAVIYALKKPNWFKEFGFHEIFHVFILIGSGLHAAAVMAFVL